MATLRERPAPAERCPSCGTRPAAVNGLIYKGRRCCAMCTADLDHAAQHAEEG